jgi:hypothetical protein
MMIEKRPGADWDVVYMDLDGERDAMTVFGAADAGEAYRDALASFTEPIEILAVVRRNIGIEIIERGLTVG